MGMLILPLFLLFKNVFVFSGAVHMKSLYIFSRFLEASPVFGNVKLDATLASTHSHCFLSLSRAQFSNAIHIPLVTVLLMNIETEVRK